MRVLILSASTGGGHMRASSALKTYIMNNDKDAVVEIIDTFEYINPILNKTVTEGYLYLATKTPKMYGTVYNTSNKENAFKSLVFGLNSLFSRKLMPLLKEFKPDVIISTHPFSTEMVSNIKGKGEIKTPLICIMTDYAPHRTWINKNVDSYVVANDGMIDIMEKMGVNRDIIHPYGIPIDETFYTAKDRDIILKELGLNPEVPTILIMAGSFGVTDILKIYDSIVEIESEFQLIVITGRNKKLYEAFEKEIAKRTGTYERKYPIAIVEKVDEKLNKVISTIKKEHQPMAYKETKLLFFTNEVDKYMQTADLIITKPGGLTVSEALACNLPMAIFNAIPGQEEENAEFLIDNNMAVRISKDSTCKDTIRNLLENREELNMMKASCESFDKSASAKNIYDLIKSLINK